jgi:hypothetical protein
VWIAYSNPVAVEDHKYTLEPNEELAVPAASGVLSSASTPEEVQLEASMVNPPNHGSATLGDDGSFTYTPAPGYFGSDSLRADHASRRRRPRRGEPEIPRWTLCATRL